MFVSIWKTNYIFNLKAKFKGRVIYNINLETRIQILSVILNLRQFCSCNKDFLRVYRLWRKNAIEPAWHNNKLIIGRIYASKYRSLLTCGISKDIVILSSIVPYKLLAKHLKNNVHWTSRKISYTKGFFIDFCHDLLDKKVNLRYLYVPWSCSVKLWIVMLSQDIL